METKDRSGSESIIPASVQKFFRTEITRSNIGENCILGDYSRIRESVLSDSVRIDRNNLIMGCNIDKYTYTGPFDMIFHADIGSYCSISYGVTIGPPDHNFSKITTHPFIYDSNYKILPPNSILENNKFKKNCRIGNDVWIGCNATILRGVTIGHGAVIGANALVNRDVPSYAVVAGVPARIIRYRFDKEIIDALLKLEWWNMPEEVLAKNASVITGDINLEQLKRIKW